MSTPDFARYAREAAGLIGADFLDLDEGRGYLWRISRNGRYVLGGAGSICAYPINSATAYAIARDKAHAKSVLKADGLPVIPGGLFFSHTRRLALRDPGREPGDALDLALRIGFPVFCKPNTASRGDYAEVIAGPDELRDYVRRIAPVYESFLLEPVMHGEEHRILVCDGGAVFHGVRSPPVIRGDGRRTVRQLIADLDTTYLAPGLSATPVYGHAPDRVPMKDERIELAGRRNLAAAGSFKRLSETAPPAMSAIALKAVASLGLRIGAVDIFDCSETGPVHEPVIIEVNGNPGLKLLEMAGRQDIIRSIWTQMYEECLSG